MSKCIEPDCHNKRMGDRKRCYTCNSRRWRKNNLITYAYNTLRGNAKRRGKEFSITKPYFRKLCLETGYHLNKGRTGEKLTIDRVRNELGYTDTNIQVVTHHYNSVKNDKDFGFMEPEAECPF